MTGPENETGATQQAEDSPFASAADEALETSHEQMTRIVYSACDLECEFPERRPMVVESMLRQGEVMNLVSASKEGKTYLAMGLAFSVAMGFRWIDLKTCQGPVLYIDNELHKETISYRLKTIREAYKVSLDDKTYGENLDYIPLRGNAEEITKIAHKIERASQSRKYALIVIDAMYRTYWEHLEENDNAAMTKFYNVIDQIADARQAAMVLVHHTSKGTQSLKSIMEIGRGAGAAGGAADTHVVLRGPEVDEFDESDDAKRVKGLAVMQSKARSWEPKDPLVMRFVHPTWVLETDYTPFEVLRWKQIAKENKAYSKPSKNGDTPHEPADPEPGRPRTLDLDKVVECLRDEGDTVPVITKLLIAAGIENANPSTTRRALNEAVSQGRAENFKKKGKADYYRIPQPQKEPEEKLIPDMDEHDE